MAITKHLKDKRPIRSYVIRSGRLTTSQKKAIDEYWADSVIPYTGELLDTENIFNDKLIPVVRELNS